MFSNKKKAITFSYDDGVTQDMRLIEILNRYGLKGTFNLNSGFLGSPGSLVREGVQIDHCKIAPNMVRKVYTNHEVAVHTMTHANLTLVTNDDEIVHQVEQDRKNLSKLVGYEVCGMAYPGGGINNNEHAAEVIKRRTKIKYARTTTSTYNFDPQVNLFRFNPTVYHVLEMDKLLELGEKFVSLEPHTPQLFYIWGHSYEFDIANTWATFEDFCKLVSRKENIYYGTNKEVLLGK